MGRNSVIRSDIGIGHRAYEFFGMKHEGVSKACKKAGIPHETVCSWQNGIVPSAYYLKRLLLLGADLNYILTGKKSSGVARGRTPCDLCRYAPPSSGNGKPCTMCPASAKEEGTDEDC